VLVYRRGAYPWHRGKAIAAYAQNEVKPPHPAGHPSRLVLR
jgi:hypothetical protein